MATAIHHNPRTGTISLSHKRIKYWNEKAKDPGSHDLGPFYLKREKRYEKLSLHHGKVYWDIDFLSRKEFSKSTGEI